MPLLDNTFVCPNGHQFNANAKIRARCPECGQLAKRNFEAKEPEPKVAATPITEKPKIKHTIMLRQGKPRMARVKTKHTVKAEPVKTEPVKTEPVKTEPAKSMAKRSIPKVKPKAKATVTKTKAVAGGLVKTQRVRGVAIPSIKRKPAKTAVARHIEGRSSRKSSYADEMIGRFGFGR